MWMVSLVFKNIKSVERKRKLTLINWNHLNGKINFYGIWSISFQLKLMEPIIIEWHHSIWFDFICIDLNADDVVELKNSKVWLLAVDLSKGIQQHTRFSISKQLPLSIQLGVFLTIWSDNGINSPINLDNFLMMTFTLTGLSRTNMFCHNRENMIFLATLSIFK